MQDMLTAAAKTTIQKNCFEALDKNSAVCCNHLSWFVDNDCA